MFRIPFNRPFFPAEATQLALEAIQSDHHSGNGPFGLRAQDLLSTLHSGSPALLTTSCTHALEASAVLLDLEPDAEVIVPAYTFVSTALAYFMSGATPRFVDVREDTLNISADLIEEAISPRTRAICVVHYGGVAAEMKEITRIAERHDLIVIEDNAHGLGGTYDSKPLGTFGAMSTLSFHETKNFSSGEGGALVLNDREYLNRAEVIREKGTNRTKFSRGLVDKYTWVDKGSSWVQSDILAATLVGQLLNFDSIQNARKRALAIYEEMLFPWAEQRGYRLQQRGPHEEDAAHLFSIRFQDRVERQDFMEHMAARGIQVVFHYQGLHDSPMGRSLGYSAHDFPNTNLASNALVRLPMYSNMAESEATEVAEAAMAFRA